MLEYDGPRLWLAGPPLLKLYDRTLHIRHQQPKGCTVCLGTNADHDVGRHVGRQQAGSRQLS